MTAARLFPLLGALALVACGGAPAPSVVPEAVPSEPAPGHEIRWVRDSAEYVAALVQTYRLAGERLEERVADKPDGSWAVVLDADETVISNLTYSVERAAIGKRWSEDSWREWALSRRATAVPGAIEFIDTVHRLGGRVAIVTNRSENVCEATRENLEALGARFDHLRCKRPGEQRKEARWDEVRTGDGTGLGPLEIVMWVGDNIRDFPELDQSSKDDGDGAFADFGVRYFMLPNPLYGSWEEE